MTAANYKGKGEMESKMRKTNLSSGLRAAEGFT